MLNALKNVDNLPPEVRNEVRIMMANVVCGVYDATSALLKPLIDESRRREVEGSDFSTDIDALDKIVEDERKLL